MKYLYLIIFLLNSLFLFSQGNSSIEMYVSPNYSNYTNKLTTEDGAVSYNFGVGYNFSSSQKINLTLGVRFADFVTKYSNDNLRWGSQHNGQGGVNPNLPSGESISGITFKNHYYFLEIPVGIKYQLLDKKIQLFIEPTINPAIFLTHRTDVTKRYEQQPNDTEVITGGFTTLRSFNFFGEIGFGALAPLGENIYLQIRPTARMQLLNAAENNTANAKFYSFGLKIGIQYFLSK